MPKSWDEIVHALGKVGRRPGRKRGAKLLLELHVGKERTTVGDEQCERGVFVRRGEVGRRRLTCLRRWRCLHDLRGERRDELRHDRAAVRRIHLLQRTDEAGLLVGSLNPDASAAARASCG